MTRTQCFLMTLVVCSSYQAANAQSLDTLRRKDADNWEFLQVKKGPSVLSEGYRHNGIPEGTFIVYWDSGYPMTITNYRNGKKNGIEMHVNAQGYTEEINNYKDELMDGPQRTYQIGTSFISEEAYYSDGKKHGPYNKRYGSGKPQEESHYNMDKRDGKTIWYYETGEKAAEYTYRNGAIDGEVSSYYKNGKVSEFGAYKNNEQVGVWKEFYENGGIKAEGKYEHGQKDGAWKQYDEKGKLVKTEKYDNGEIK
jgi:antitoxin component YwqK of YwqJK toxin-antitoxin module